MKKERSTQAPWLAGMILVIFLIYGQALAQNSPLRFGGEAKWKKRLGAPQRIASDLIRMTEEARTVATYRMSGQSSTVVDTKPSLIRHVNGLPELEVCLNTTDEASFREARGFLTSLGMTVTQSYQSFGRIYGTLDLSRLDELNGTPHLSTVHPNYLPACSMGAVTSEGDAAMRTDRVRTDIGLNGTGIKVGVMSDSFNKAGIDLSGSIEAGELPGNKNPNGYTTPVTVLSEYTGNDGSDEGRAMIEIVHDVAPGASLMFHTAFTSKAAFAEAYASFAANGADVIVDDVTYFSEAWFQDGIVAQAVQQAVDDGILVFSSAGNLADHAIEAFYKDIAPDETDSRDEVGKDVHDFGGGDAYARVTVADGNSLTAFMQWNQPFEGTLGPGASTDLDLYLVDLDSGTPLASSTNSQGCTLGAGINGGDPFEGIGYTNSSGGSKNVGLVVDRACGPKDNLRFKIICIGSFSNDLDEALFSAPTVSGHAAAEGIISVGAVNYSVTDAFNDPPLNTVPGEYFTSLGEGIAYYFDENGHALADAPVLRSKPDLAAPDGGATSVTGFESFYGTSAAAPHVAALAALMLQRDASTPLLVTDCMRAGSVDVGAGSWDGYTGNGLVHGPNALALLDAGGEGVYAIEAGSGPHGSVSPSGRMICYTPGTSVTLPPQDHTFTFTPDAGCHVEDVLINGVSQGPMSSYTFSRVIENQTLRVAFEPDAFTITASDSFGGRIIPSGTQTVAYGTSLRYTFTADAGHHIKEVLVNGVSAGGHGQASYVLNISQVVEDLIISATFEEDTAEAGGACFISSLSL